MGGWWFVANANSTRYDGWNWPIIFSDRRSVLWPARTPLARRHARTAEPGDLVFGYTAGNGWRCITALCRIGELEESDGFTGRELIPLYLLANRITRAALKAEPGFATAEPLRNRFGSIFTLTRTEAHVALRLILAGNPELEQERDELQMLIEL